MIFIAGAFVFGLGIFMLLKTLLMRNKNILEVQVLEIFKQKIEEDTVTNRKHNHARVKYFNSEAKEQDGVFLLKSRKAQVDDLLKIVENKKKGKIEEYAPQSDMIGSVIVMSIGALIMGLCVSILDTFDAL